MWVCLNMDISPAKLESELEVPHFQTNPCVGFKIQLGKSLGNMIPSQLHLRQSATYWLVDRGFQKKNKKKDEQIDPPSTNLSTRIGVSTINIH